MNHLFRELAPVSDAAWAEIEDEAKRSLGHLLAARKLIDYSSGDWTTSVHARGRIAGEEAADGVETAVREVQPLTEVRVPFVMLRSELDAADRGATDVDTNPVIDAAEKAARQATHGRRSGARPTRWIRRSRLSPRTASSSAHSPPTTTAT